MGTIIALNGKGGTGKTTISALLIEYISSKKKGSLLAVDADPNSSLPELLGIKDVETIVGIVEEISKNLDKIPKGVTKDLLIEMRVQESLVEAKGFDLLAMGRPEGPGCYCYVNNLLRDIMARITKNYDFVIIDNAAGMEHISRRTMARIDKLVVVSDYSVMGVRSAKRIYDLAKELKIKIEGAFLIVNKIIGSMDALNEEIQKTGLKLIGTIPYAEELNNMSVSDLPIFELKDKVIKAKVDEVFGNLMRG